VGVLRCSAAAAHLHNPGRRWKDPGPGLVTSSNTTTWPRLTRIL
jgi:hypothetical protein